MKIYRKIWIENFGEIPKDKNNRTYEIHHIDGNHHNNELKNLICIPIDEHYKLHYENGDYGACVMIAKRMKLTPDYISNIQRGVKRPGIGGVKKGTIPWNKGIKGYKLKNLSEKGRFNMSQAGKKNAKIKGIDLEKIIFDFKNKIEIKDYIVDEVMSNGRKMTYARAFSKTYGKL